MATIIMGSYMVRYPLGGNLSWALQYLTGLKKLGHDVYCVEKFVHEDSCYDPVNKVMTNDCSFGVRAVSELLSRHGLGDNWCFVSSDGIYHGRCQRQIDEIFARADLYIENGAHGVWYEEAVASGAVKAYIDVDPAFTQIKWYRRQQQHNEIPVYDHYFTNGLNIGKEGNVIPSVGIQWKKIFNPVNTDLFKVGSSKLGSPYSTIMNWVSYDETVTYQGVTYGHKSMEFDKFIDLPLHVEVPMEIAVAAMLPGKQKQLLEKKWKISNAQEITATVDSFREYLANCRGEFSVVKNMYHATSSGWFSDKSAAFLASGRPVVLQSTGFEDHLPTGEGLFAVHTVDEAKDAIDRIEGDYEFHARRAVEIAREYLDTDIVLRKFLEETEIS